MRRFVINVADVAFRAKRPEQVRTAHGLTATAWAIAQARDAIVARVERIDIDQLVIHAGNLSLNLRLHSSLFSVSGIEASAATSL